VQAAVAVAAEVVELSEFAAFRLAFGLVADQATTRVLGFFHRSIELSEPEDLKEKSIC